MWSSRRGKRVTAAGRAHKRVGDGVQKEEEKTNKQRKKEKKRKETKLQV